jgi:hypothetical protein
MKPIRRHARSIFACALLILSAVLAAGCGTIGRPAPLALPTAAAVDSTGETPQGWWRAKFRLRWPEDEDPRWFMDLLIADRIVKPVLGQHREKIALWRFHRRAGRDSAGHQFSFLFYARRDTARQVLSEMSTAPLLASLRSAGMLDAAFFDEPDGPLESGISATSDARWPESLRIAWPYYIMGVSGLWLELIQQTADAPSPPESDIDRLTAYYRGIDRRMNDLWEDEAQHALLHHLNAVFGYRPLMIQKKMRF